MRALSVLLLAVPLVTRAALAQSASPYVPLDHWAMPYVEHLISAGVIRDPTPLTRPLKESAILHALATADTTRLPQLVRSAIRRLADVFRVRPSAFRVELAAGAAVATHTVRDPLEVDRGVTPIPPDGRGFGSAGADVRLSFGPVLAVSHAIVDTRLAHDPDWYATIDNSTRFTEAYLDGQWRVGELFFGILDRNWGPSVVPGVLLSSNPYSMDHFALTLGTGGVQLQSVATELDTRTDTAGQRVNRYFVLNRLWIRPPGRWTVALWDGGVLAGVGRQLEPWMWNPASITYFRGSSGPINNFLGVDFERTGGVTLFGQVMLDDIQVSRKDAGDLEPASFALTAGAKGRIGTAGLAWTAYYTQVANLSYRTTNPSESPLYFGLGTGRNFSDYDQATAKLSVLVGPLVILEPEVTVLRQGQGDPRLPYPDIPSFPTTPVLLQGVVERIARFALGARIQQGGMSITGNGGVHFVHNVGHVPDATKTRWLGSLSVTYRFHHEGPLP